MKSQNYTTLSFSGQAERKAMEYQINNGGLAGKGNSSLNTIYESLERRDEADDEQQDELMDIDSLNDAQLKNQVNQHGIQVFTKDTGEKKEIDSAEEAYFALLAKQMLDLAARYKKDIEYIHDLYFNVSANQEKMIRYLEGCKQTKPWGHLEDLALQDDPESPSFKYVLNDRGQEEVN